MDIITLNEENLAAEHICCGFSDKKLAHGTALKKELIRRRLADGFQFKKFDIRGKAFIEAVPAEYAWCPIDAAGYLFIHCFWVSGRYKNQGLGSRLLAECVAEAEGLNGVVTLTSQKKLPFLNDKNFLLKQGFEVCDSAPPSFELIVKKFRTAPAPQFRPVAKQGRCEHASGLVFYYSDLCPYTDFWVDEMLRFAKKFSIASTKIKIDSLEAARNAPSPFTIFSAFYEGKFLTHELMLEKKFDAMLSKIVPRHSD